VSAPDKTEEYRRDCLARWVMNQPHDVQVQWAEKQSQAVRDDIRSRIIRMKREMHADRSA